MDKRFIYERNRKIHKIDELYSARNGYEHIVQKLGIPYSVVQKVCKLLNYSHTIKRTPENVAEGQKVSVVIDLSSKECAVLDKYKF